jgi:hypothetical protein
MGIFIFACIIAVCNTLNQIVSQVAEKGLKIASDFVNLKFKRGTRHNRLFADSYLKQTPACWRAMHYFPDSGGTPFYP